MTSHNREFQAAFVLCMTLAMVIVSVGYLQAATVQALTFPPQAGTTSDFVNGVDGWEFVPTVNVTVTGLGYYDDNEDGLLTPHTVGIFNTATETLVTPTVIIDSSDGLDQLFRFEVITPVILSAGQSYTVAGDSVSPFDPLVDNPAGTSFASEIQFVQYRTSQGGFQFPTFLSPSQFFAAVNFQFVPEPSTITLAALALGLLAHGRRCRAW